MWPRQRHNPWRRRILHLLSGIFFRRRCYPRRIGRRVVTRRLVPCVSGTLNARGEHRSASNATRSHTVIVASPEHQLCHKISNIHLHAYSSCLTIVVFLLPSPLHQPIAPG